MRRTTLILAALLSLSCHMVAIARLSGRVVDEKGEGVAFAQLVAFDNDSTAIGNTLSETDGSFSFQSPGITFINASAFGYEQTTARVTGDTARMLIRLTPSAQALSGVTVTANRTPVARLDGNALAVNVAGTTLAMSGSANDMLGKIPTVSGRDGQFSVFGRGAATIYINGRLMTSTAELDRLQASDIKEVRVISNPGPKYSSSTRAVIEIRTKRPPGEGVGISASARGRAAYYFSPLARLNLTYRNGGLDLELAGMHWKDRFRFSTDASQEIYTSRTVTLDMDQTVKNVQTNNLALLRLNYRLSPEHSLGGYCQMWWTKEDMGFSNHTVVTEGTAVTENVRNLGQEVKRTYPQYTANAYYSGKFGNVEIDYNMDYMGSGYDTRAHHEEDSEVSPDRTVTSLYENESRMWAHKLVASFGAGRSRTEAGAEYTDSRISMDYENHTDVSLSDDNDVRERNLAVFGQYTISLSDRLSLSAGLRYEHVNFRYSSDKAADGGRRRTYDNLFPSASVSYSSGRLGMSLSYSMSMRRPSYRNLDGNVTYANRFMYIKGNPDLKPTKRGTVELAATWRPLFLRASFTDVSDPVLRETSVVDPGNNVCMETYANGGRIRELDIIAGASLGGKAWSLQPSAGIEKQWFTTLFRDEPLSLGKPCAVIRCDGSVRLPGEIWLMGDVSLRTSGNSSNRYSYSATVLNLSLYRSFLGGKLSLWITGKDLLDGYSSHSLSYSNNILFNAVNKMYMRGCEITLAYNLNVPKSRYKGSGAGNAEKSRL